MMFEKSWQSGEASGDWKKENIALIFKKGRNKGGLQELLNSHSHLCASENHETDHSRSTDKAHGR